MPTLPESHGNTLTTNIIATPQLIFEVNGSRQQLELLEQTTWTIGRHNSNQIQIRDSGVSRHHARIDTIQGHHCLFIDLQSSNGSRINDQPITEPILLKHRDRIKIGKQELIFQHSMLTIPGTPIPAPIKQVLMLQTSAIQGKIWQEILFSQHVSAVWGAPGADLQTVIEANATAQTLPKLLLVDISPYRTTYTHFCQWCATHYPQVNVVFIDRKPESTPLGPHNLPPCMHHLSAYPETELNQHVTEIMANTTKFLQIFDGRTLRRSALNVALTSLEQLLLEVPAFATLLPPSASSPIDPPLEQDEQTEFLFAPNSPQAI